MQTYAYENIIHKRQFDLQFTLRFDLIDDVNFFSPFHWHNHIELIYVLEGEIEVKIESKQFILQPNSIGIINSEKIHSTKLKGHTRYILLQVPLSAFNQIDNDSIFYNYVDHITKDYSLELRTILQNMLQIADSKTAGIKLKFVSLLYELLFILIQKFRTQSNFQECSNFSKSGINRISPVIAYLEKNFKKDISLTDVASIISVTPEHLCRLLKQYTGQTFTEYVLSLRIASFYQSLQNSQIKISALLEENGIKNYKVFIREFKKTFNKTPAQIRKEQI